MEKTVEEMLEEILENQQTILERLDLIEEGLRNVSTPGRDYSVYEVDE